MLRDLRHDLYAALAAALLVATAVLVGDAVEDRDGTLRVSWPPLLATWDPHVGPGTPAALVVAVAVVAYGPSLAARLPWRALLVSVWGAGMAWTWSLALVDGWYRGIAEQLTTRNEYLPVVDRFHDIPAALADFTRHILIDAPDNWPAHVAGHPPGATLTFVLLDRIGLGGGGWAGVWCITVGTTAAVAVLVAVRALADERLARRAAPFLVLAPAAVWVGTSADGYFAAVAAWAVAFLALGKLEVVFSPVDETPVFTLTGGIFKDAPHPNAAKLYLTWFLAKEQQAKVGSFSSRADVPPPEGFKPLTSYKIANNYREFMIDDKLIAELRKRMEGYTGPPVNKGGVR